MTFGQKKENVSSSAAVAAKFERQRYYSIS
jgi:hypothetical protein